MSYNEFRKWLLAQGVIILKKGNGGSHFKVRAPNGNQTILPNHGAKEISEGLRRSIIKQLGLKD